MRKDIAEGKRPHSKKKLTTKEWAKIKSRYLQGDVMAAIAYDCKINKSTIATRAKAESWPAHGSRKAALEEKIARAEDEDVIDSYKTAVAEANKKHLNRFEQSARVVNGLLSAASMILKDKMIMIEEFDARRVHYPDSFNLTEEAKTIQIAVNCMQRLTGGTERSILGIEDKPVLTDDAAEHATDEMFRSFQSSVERYFKTKDEEKARAAEFRRINLELENKNND